MRRAERYALDLGFMPAEVRGMVRHAVQVGLERGHNHRQLFAYLELVNPLLPYSREMAIWQRQVRRLVGRRRRHREVYRERVGYLPLGVQ